VTGKIRLVRNPRVPRVVPLAFLLVVEQPVNYRARGSLAKDFKYRLGTTRYYMWCYEHGTVAHWLLSMRSNEGLGRSGVELRRSNPALSICPDLAWSICICIFSIST
jgi:hypothetical protein